MKDQKKFFNITLSALLSVLAFLISLFALYDSSLKPADLRFYMGPDIQVFASSRGDTDSFSIPFVVTNEGSKAGFLYSYRANLVNTTTGDMVEFRAIQLQSGNSKSATSIRAIGIPANRSAGDVINFYPLEGGAEFRFSESESYQLAITVEMIVSRYFGQRKENATYNYNFSVDPYSYRVIRSGRRAAPIPLEVEL